MKKYRIVKRFCFDLEYRFFIQSKDWFWGWFDIYLPQINEFDDFESAMKHLKSIEKIQNSKDIVVYENFKIKDIQIEKNLTTTIEDLKLSLFSKECEISFLIKGIRELKKEIEENENIILKLKLELKKDL